MTIKERNQYDKGFNIVLSDNKEFVLASCPTLELAEKYLRDIQKNDKKLAKYYNWQKLPKYEIVKTI
ncbi:MAG: hypothetical protein IJV31_08010 [Clostridia bacterium]|nr:hypothetical protein [Clostridia bacterium]